MATFFWLKMGLADGDERHALVALVAHHAVGAGVEGWLAINKELVAVMPVMKIDLRAPRAVKMPVHRVRVAVPLVEIPDHAHFLRFRGNAQEIDRLGHCFGRVASISVTVEL